MKHKPSDFRVQRFGTILLYLSATPSLSGGGAGQWTDFPWIAVLGIPKIKKEANKLLFCTFNRYFFLSGQSLLYNVFHNNTVLDITFSPTVQNFLIPSTWLVIPSTTCLSRPNDHNSWYFSLFYLAKYIEKCCWSIRLAILRSLNIFLLLCDIENASDVVKCLNVISYPNDVLRYEVFFATT